MWIHLLSLGLIDGAGGNPGVSGSASVTNANDTLAAAGSPVASGSLVRTNANDSLSASGSPTVNGSLSTTNANDVLSASGNTGLPTGAVNVNNNNDTLSADGSTPSAIGGGAPGARPWVAYINGHRVAGSYWDIKRWIEELAEEQAEKEVIRDKAPKRARIVIDAGKKLPQLDRHTETEALAVQRDIRQVYSLAYAKAKLRLEQDRDEEESILLLI